MSSSADTNPLRSARKARALTLTLLARQAGVSPAALSQIESGTRKASPSLALKLSGILGVPYGQLFGESSTALADARTGYYRALEQSGLPEEKERFVEQVSIFADSMMRNADKLNCRDLHAIKTMAQEFHQECVARNGGIREAALAMARARFRAGKAESDNEPTTWSDLRGVIQRSLESRGAQARLADHLDVSKQRLHRYLKGEDNPPADIVLQMLRWVRENAGSPPHSSDPRE